MGQNARRPRRHPVGRSGLAQDLASSARTVPYDWGCVRCSAAQCDTLCPDAPLPARSPRGATPQGCPLQRSRSEVSLLSVEAAVLWRQGLLVWFCVHAVCVGGPATGLHRWGQLCGSSSRVDHRGRTEVCLGVVQHSTGTDLTRLGRGRKRMPPAPFDAQIRLRGVKRCWLHRLSSKSELRSIHAEVRTAHPRLRAHCSDPPPEGPQTSCAEAGYDRDNSVTHKLRKQILATCSGKLPPANSASSGAVQELPHSCRTVAP